MDVATKKGIGFGLTSGIITTIGTMVGLAEGTGLKIAVVGGILTVAVADAFVSAVTCVLFARRSGLLVKPRLNPLGRKFCPGL